MHVQNPSFGNLVKAKNDTGRGDRDGGEHVAKCEHI